MPQYEYLESESALLIGVRNRIQAQLGYREDQCQIQDMEMVPAEAGDTYITVTSGGNMPGQCHDPENGTIHEVIGVVVTLIMKVGGTPRDRRTSLYLGTLTSLNYRLNEIRSKIDKSYDLLTEVNSLLSDAGGITSGDVNTDRQGFIVPLKWQGYDPRPRVVGAEVFDTPDASVVGLARSVRFGGAERFTRKTQA